MLKRFLLLVSIFVVLALPLAAQNGVTLTPFTSDNFGIQGLAPEGWNEVAPGVYARSNPASDPTLIAIQSAPVDKATLLQSLLPQLALTEAPEAIDSLETATSVWDIYQIDVTVPGGVIRVDLGIAELDGSSAVVLLQTSEEDYDSLHEDVFLPVVESVQTMNQTDASLYSDPDGSYTVPIPTNWTAEDSDGFGIMKDPNEDIFFYFLVTEGDDATQSVADNWETVGIEIDPDDEPDIQEVPSGEGVDKTTLITYVDEDNERIYQAIAQQVGDQQFIMFVDTDQTAAAQRNAQIQIIASGFKILALDETDLSDATPNPITDELLAELEAFIVDTMEKLDVPGASVAIVQGDEVIYRNGFGVREMGSDEPVTPETMMMIGSTTKTMTTLILAQLVDEGLISWDTPVVDVFPDFAVADPELSQTLTIENLVCACTGVPRKDLELVFNASELSPEDIIASLQDFEFFTDFGEAFQYSNQMVATGGYMATLVDGGEYGNLATDFRDTFQHRVFDPIGMNNSTFSFEEITNRENVATPHSIDTLGNYEPVPLSIEQTLEPIAPAGTLWSNVDDMARYIMTELNTGVTPDGERIVSEENLEYTWSPQIPIDAETDYGLGWFVSNYKGLPMLGHGGNNLGFSSDMSLFPTIDTGIITLSNQQGSLLNGLIQARLLELLYDQDFDSDELLEFVLQQRGEGVQELEDSLIDIDEEFITPFTGTFSNELLGEIDITFEDGILTMDAGEFASEIRASYDENTDETIHFLFTAPIAGLPIEFLEEDGALSIKLGTLINEFIFTPVE